MCWRVGNITPVPKSGSANSCPSDYCPITITLVLSEFLRALWLSVSITLLKRETSS